MRVLQSYEIMLFFRDHMEASRPSSGRLDRQLTAIQTFSQDCARHLPSTFTGRISMLGLAQCILDGMALTAHGVPRSVLVILTPGLFALSMPQGGVIEIPLELSTSRGAQFHVLLIALLVRRA